MQMLRKSQVMLFTILVTGLVLLRNQAVAQTAQEEQDEMNKIYARYDTLDYITFDVNYRYSTDTVNGDYKADQLNGTYTLAGKRALYNIGNIQFMQNDSFLIAVYPDEKIIIVSDPQQNSQSGIPLRSLIDSLFGVYSQHYTITDGAASSEGVISFVRSDSLAQYNQFQIDYDTASNYINSIQYDFDENDLLEPDDSTQSEQIITHKKRLVIQFQNYRVANFSDSLYDESNYIWFENGKCKPVDKYKGYQVYYSKSAVPRNSNPIGAN